VGAVAGAVVAAGSVGFVASATAVPVALDGPLPNVPAEVSERMTAVLLDDGFDGDALDAAVWTRGWFGDDWTVTPPVNSGEPQCYDPANAVVADGALTLDIEEKASICGGIDRAYASGMVNGYSKFTIRPGNYIEARVFVAGDEGEVANQPTFWMQGQSLNWPSNGSIVVMKGQADGICGEATDGDGSKSGGCADLTMNAWHTVGVFWTTDGTAEIYYDGDLQWSFPLGTTDPMYPILNLGALGDVTAPSQLVVDYVRAWDTLPQVVPIAPTLIAAECDVEPTLAIPEVDGVVYTERRVGYQASVTAAAAEGYAIAKGAQTTWTFDLTPEPCGPGGSVDPLPEAPRQVTRQMREVLLDDGFDGDGLDLGVWNRGWVDGHDGQMTTGANPAIEWMCYGPDNVNVQDGELHLDFVRQDSSCTVRGDTYDYQYTSGMIQSWKKFTVAPGSFVESRIHTSGAGTVIENWPAFWTNGESHDWPETGEIDVLESLDGGRACASVHTTPGSAKQCVDIEADAWHTYGAHWRLDGVVDFYYDGQLLASHPFNATDRQYLILNLSAWNGVPAVAPSRLSVDYVRAWSTVDTEAPTVTISSDEVDPGDTITAHAANLVDYEVTFALAPAEGVAGAPAIPLSTSPPVRVSQGTADAELSIPTDIEPGDYEIRVLARSGALRAATTLAVAGEPTPEPSTPGGTPSGGSTTPTGGEEPTGGASGGVTPGGGGSPAGGRTAASAALAHSGAGPILPLAFSGVVLAALGMAMRLRRRSQLD